MYFSTLAPAALIVATTHAYPWLTPAGGSDFATHLQGRAAATCPTIAKPQGAAPYSSYYPSQYTGAKNGLPGTGKGGVQVPAPGDTAHHYVAPGPNDIRGPCPAINMFANHNFISHDGLTTFTELVDAAQNVFNWNYDLAVFVATFGLVQDGDPVTGQLSIGCQPGLATSNTGLDTHNKFEVDASLARTDYFLSPTGDAYSVNGSLFGEMVNTCGSSAFSAECMAMYCQKRFNESRETNGNFFNGFITFFVYGTSLLPLNSFANFVSGTAKPTVADMANFWGTTQRSDGSWYYTRNETLPAKWYNRPDSYHFATIVAQISAQYLEYMSSLGGNTGAPDTFVGLTYPGFVENGTVQDATPQGVACFLLQIVSIGMPTSLTQTLGLSSAQTSFVKSKFGSMFASYTCPSN